MEMENLKPDNYITAHSKSCTSNGKSNASKLNETSNVIKPTLKV
jgi:hypothetical protein